MSRDLTLILPHFSNLGMFSEQQRVWLDYPAKLRSALHVIVVDDASPKGQRPSSKQVTVHGLGSLRIFRCTKKVRWNWLFARNLGVLQAGTKWLLLTDIDHVLPVETLARILGGELHEDRAYRLSRADAPHAWPYALTDCPSYKPHPNTWLMTKGLYNAIGGYDERLSGCYGTDAEFRTRVANTARAVTMLPEVMVRYPREIIADASTTIYTRKNDPVNDADLSKRRDDRDKIPNWRPLRVTFPYTLEYDSTHREATCSPS